MWWNRIQQRRISKPSTDLGEAELVGVAIIDRLDLLHGDEIVVLGPDEGPDGHNDARHAEADHVARQHDVILKGGVDVDGAVAHLGGDYIYKVCLKELGSCLPSCRPHDGTDDVVLWGLWVRHYTIDIL